MNRTNPMSVKFGGACYAFRMFIICNVDTLKSVFSKTTEICWLSCAKKEFILLATNMSRQNTLKTIRINW